MPHLTALIIGAIFLVSSPNLVVAEEF